MPGPPSGGARRPAALAMLSLAAALLLAPGWPGAPRLAAAQGQGGTPEQLAASEAATATEFDAFEDALSLSAQTAGGRGRGGKGGTAKGSFSDAEKLLQLQEGMYYIGGAPDAFPTCRFKDGAGWDRSKSSRRPDCNNFVPLPARDQRDCSTCVTQAVATAIQMSVAATLQEPVERWEVNAASLYYCSNGGRTCQTGWDIQEALNFLIDGAPTLVRPTSCLSSVIALNRTDLEPSVSSWAPICSQASAAMQSCNRVNPAGAFLSCRYKSLGTFWEMQRHVRRHGAVITRLRIPSDFEKHFGRNASQYGGEEFLPYRAGDTARGLYGHAAVIVGYNNTERTWTLLNSWGDSSASSTRLGVTQDGLFKVQMGLLAIGTPDLTYGVECTPAPGSPSDLHESSPWEGKAARVLELEPRQDKLNLSASCYTYRFDPRTDSVSAIVDHFGVNMTRFVRDNEELFPNVTVSYPFVGVMVQQDLQAVLGAANAVLVPSDPRNPAPFARCTYFGPPGGPSEVQLNCTDDAGKCMSMGVNGTTSCKLLYSAANVSDVLPQGTALRVCNISWPGQLGQLDRLARFSDPLVSQPRALKGILRAFGLDDLVPPLPTGGPDNYCDYQASAWATRSCDEDGYVTSIAVIDPKLYAISKPLTVITDALLLPLLRLERLQELELRGLDGPLPPQLGALGRLRILAARFYCPWDGPYGGLPLWWLHGWPAADNITITPQPRGSVVPKTFSGRDCGITTGVPKQWSSAVGAATLSILNITNNWRLGGKLPPLANMTALATLDLSRNAFVSWLPAGWAAMSKVRVINLADNFGVAGVVHRDWAQMASLAQLYVNNTAMGSCVPLDGSRVKVYWANTSITTFCTKSRAEQEAIEATQVAAITKILPRLFPKTSDRDDDRPAEGVANFTSTLDFYNDMVTWASDRGMDRLAMLFSGLVGFPRIGLSFAWDHEEGIIYATTLMAVRLGLNLTLLSDFTASLPRLGWLQIYDSVKGPGTGPDALRLPPDLAMRAPPSLVNLTIVNSSLEGPLPSRWGGWSTLQQLRLELNGLRGPLPAQWGRMTSLQLLSLGGNRLKGQLPGAAWNRMASLKRVLLRSNGFDGTIPPQWGRLRSLELVDLASNLLQGALPAEWSALLSLQRLGLSNNSIGGPLPSSWRELRGLQPGLGPLGEWTLDLGGNDVIGTLPPSWGDSGSSMPNGITIELSGNKLGGGLPPSWSRFGQVSIQGASFEGCVPAGMPGPWPPGTKTCTDSEAEAVRSLRDLLVRTYGGTSPALVDWLDSDDKTAHCNKKVGITCDDKKRVVSLDLSRLGLSVARPAALNTTELFMALAGMPNLQELAAPGLRLAGPLPDLPMVVGGVVTLDKLRVINLSNNPLITGNLPKGWDALQQLEVVDLSGCSRVGGSLPGGWAALQSLRVLRAAGTSVSGQLPPLYGLLSGLVELDVGGTWLQGPAVPPAWVDPSEMNVAVAASGVAAAAPLLASHAVPAPTAAAASGAGASEPAVFLSRLEVLRLADNSFSGTLDARLSGLPALRVLDLSVALDKGKIAGSLPSQWGSLSSLEELSLAGHQLSGSLPQLWLTLRNMTRLSLANNSLTGALPSTWISMGKLQWLDLSQNNKLTGNMPASWVKMAWCSKVDLTGTAVAGCPPKGPGP